MIYFVTESGSDGLDQLIFTKILQSYTDDFRQISNNINGKDDIFVKHWKQLLSCGQRQITIVLTDLDDSESCITSYLESLFRKGLLKAPKSFQGYLHIFLAAREIEKWIISDVRGFSAYFDVNIEKVKNRISNDPDELLLHGVKEKIMELVAHHGGSRFKKFLLKDDGKFTRDACAEFNNHLKLFSLEKWNFGSARNNSKSLNRTGDRLKSLLLSDVLTSESSPRES